MTEEGPGGRRTALLVGIGAVVVVVAVTTTAVVLNVDHGRAQAGGSTQHGPGVGSTTTSTVGPPLATVVPSSTITGTGNGPPPSPLAAPPDVAPWRTAVIRQDLGFFVTQLGIDPAYVRALPGEWFGLGMRVTASFGANPDTSTTTTVDVAVSRPPTAALIAVEAGLGRLGFRFKPPGSSSKRATSRTAPQYTLPGTLASDAQVTVTAKRRAMSVAEVVITVERNGFAPPTAPAFAPMKAVALAAGAYSFGSAQVTFLDLDLPGDFASRARFGTLSAGLHLDWDQNAPASVDKNAAVDRMAAALCPLPGVSCDPANQVVGQSVERSVTLSSSTDSGTLSASVLIGDVTMTDIEADLDIGAGL